MADRVWDKYIAYQLGYRVAQLEGTELYLLHKPHRRELGGLSAIKGPGPDRKPFFNPNRLVAYTEEEAWEWVPNFSTDVHHAEKLKVHFFMVLDHLVPAFCISAEQISRYCITYFRSKLKR